MLKTVVMTASLAAGLLMIDVAQPDPARRGRRTPRSQRRAPTVPAGQGRAARPRGDSRACMSRARSPPSRSPRPRSASRRPSRRRSWRRRSFRMPAAEGEFQSAAEEAASIRTCCRRTIRSSSSPNPLQASRQPACSSTMLKLGRELRHAAEAPFPQLQALPSVVKIANKSWPILKALSSISSWVGQWAAGSTCRAVHGDHRRGDRRAYYYPEPCCRARTASCGVTPDGCRLDWQEVPFDAAAAVACAVLRAPQRAAESPSGRRRGCVEIFASRNSPG